MLSLTSFLTTYLVRRLFSLPPFPAAFAIYYAASAVGPYAVNFPLRGFLPLAPALVPCAETGVSSFSKIEHETGAFHNERYSERS